MPFVLLLLLTLTACSTAPKTVGACVERDWYEIGRRDGAQGAALDRVLGYARECGGALLENDQLIYLNGRNAGLVEYCQPDSAFQLGRADQPYRGVCPPTAEADFVANYRRGQEARSLERRGRDLDAEIERLSDELLNAREPARQRRLSARLNGLRDARARAERELSRVRR